MSHVHCVIYCTLSDLHAQHIFAQRNWQHSQTSSLEGILAESICNAFSLLKKVNTDRIFAMKTSATSECLREETPHLSQLRSL